MRAWARRGLRGATGVNPYRAIGLVVVQAVSTIWHADCLSHFLLGPLDLASDPPFP